MTTKSKLLEILEQNKENYLSGNELAKRLEISRTAVWKGMKSLQQEGYSIVAVTNKGYLLEENNDILSEEGIRLQLKKKDVLIEVWKEITSTNQRMKQLAVEKKLPHGSVVIAQSQSEGKGRKGRKFYSPKDSGLYLSILLYPKKTTQESLEITAAVAVAVCKAVENCCDISLGIKWVNDLYLGCKKVCGILTEAVTDFETGDIEFVVVGIGLNLYEPIGGFPKDLEEKAGAILPFGHKVNKNKLVGKMVNQILEETMKVGIDREYVDRNIVPGKRIRISFGETEREVLAKEILDDGKLLVINEKNEEEIFPSGDVSVRW